MIKITKVIGNSISEIKSSILSFESFFLNVLLDILSGKSPTNKLLVLSSDSACPTIIILRLDLFIKSSSVLSFEIPLHFFVEFLKSLATVILCCCWHFRNSIMPYSDKAAIIITVHPSIHILMPFTPFDLGLVLSTSMLR